MSVCYYEQLKARFVDERKVDDVIHLYNKYHEKYGHPEVIKEIVKKLKDIYKENYIPQHSDSQYYNLLMYLKEYELKEYDFTYNSKKPNFWQLFSIQTQHVHGATKEELFDCILDMKK